MDGKRNTFLKIFLVLLIIYIFFCSIQLMGHSLKLFGTGFAEKLIETTSNPIIGLLMGVLATSLIQSSSTTTSITVGLVAGGALTLPNAIPIIMGANIGTTVTNTLVSMAHIRRKSEFKRAFAGATVHDFFNILAVIVLFPLEMSFHLIEKIAIFLSDAFMGIGGIKFMSPLKIITDPAVNFIEWGFKSPLPMLLLALSLLFFALVYLVKVLRLVVVPKVEEFFDAVLFRNDLISFNFGLIVTALVQSSSVTTSLVIPLVGAGILTVKKILPYTLGANIGTTITAMLAAFCTLNPIAITTAFSHLVFNILGILIFYPLKAIPIGLAKWFAEITAQSKKNTTIFLFVYYLLHILPLGWLIFK